MQLGTLGNVVASRAEFADLVVLPKPYGEGARAGGRGDPRKRALRDAGAGAGRTARRAEALSANRILIGWNESAEALAAIRAALPLLLKAASVTIAIIDPPPHGRDRSDPGGVLAEMLARHGVRADIAVLARTMPRVSDVMCRHANDIEADLIVMGAYGHSRLREAILGGATRNMLEASPLPVFMAH